MDDFEKENSKVLGELRERTTRSELVWHYTNWNALHKISEKGGTWWASHAAFLNDTQELTHGIKFFLTELENQPYPATKELLAIIEQNIRDSETYVIAFSKAFDDLSQWRAYGGSELSVSIGVRMDAITRMTDGYQIKFLECLYRDDVKRAEIQRIIAPLAQSRKALEEEAERIRTSETYIHPTITLAKGHHRGQQITASIYGPQFAAQAKNSAFENEKEHRLVVKFGSVEETRTRIGAVNMGFHAKGRLLVPHICLPRRREGEDEPIAAVLVGPNPHEELAVAAVKRMLTLHDITADVAISTAPYRSW